MTDIVIAAATNSPRILDANLKRSPLLVEGRARLHEVAGAPSASVAYNRALDATDEPLVVLAHQDVYLPKGWEEVLLARIRDVEAQDPDWALLGTFGVGLDGRPIGPVWSSSLGMIVGRVPLRPTRVQSYDELLIVIRRASGLRFDEALPGWHMYGTDIAQTARAAGKGAYAGALPCVHNDGFHEALGPDFAECYRYVQRKWWSALPLRTPITKVSHHGLHLLRDAWRLRSTGAFRRGMAVGSAADARALAARCGWGDLTASA